MKRTFLKPISFLLSLCLLSALPVLSGGEGGQFAAAAAETQTTTTPSPSPEVSVSPSPSPDSSVSPSPDASTSPTPDASTSPLPSETPTPTPPAVPVTKIQIAVFPASASTTLEPKQTLKLEASCAPTDASDKSVTWSSSQTDVAIVDKDGLVTAQGAGKATITARSVSNSNVSSEIQVTVSGITLPKTLELLQGNTSTLAPTRYGSAQSVTQWSWTSANANVARVHNGLVTAVEPGTTTVTCSAKVGQLTYSAVCSVTVKSSTAPSIDAELEDGKLSFADLSEDFEKACHKVTGGSLSYLTSLLVSTSEGTLFYNYVSEAETGSGVATSGRYYLSNSNTSTSRLLLSRITFVPKADYLGKATIRFNGYSTGGRSFSGTVIVDAKPESEITYVSTGGEPIYFHADDFSQQCQSENGRPVSYVTFSVPDEKYGYLYRNYTGGTVYDTNVSSTDRFYRTSSPTIDSLTFLPAKDFAGTFTISYEGCDTMGISFRGALNIQVSTNTLTGNGEVKYATTIDKKVTFSAADFDDACRDATGSSLERLRFSALPSSREGTLTYNKNDSVAISTSYYRTGSTRSIGKVIFTPASEYVGTVKIPFTGYNARGDSFDGTVVITVGGGILEYTVPATGRLYFDSDDFSNLCYETTGRQFSYIRFPTLPASSSGVLYYREKNKVSTSVSYYRTGSSSSRLLEDVSFVPASSFSGTVSIPFSGYDAGRDRFMGTIQIKVVPSQAELGNASAIAYATTGSAVSLRLDDFTGVCGAVLPAQLSKVRFAAPDRSTGALYVGYESPTKHLAFEADRDYSTSTLSQLAFVPKAGFYGVAQLSYAAADVSGNTCQGVVEITVSAPGSSRYFSDLTACAWAAPSIDFLCQYGIVEGTGGNQYTPSAQMQRGDFVLMLSRAFSLPASGSSSFADVPSSSYYAQAIAAAKNQGIITGDANGNFRPADPITRQDAALYLYRCLLKQGTVSPGTTADLIRFPDRDQLSGDNMTAMAALVREGVFTGTDTGLLMPSGILDRAQLAVILHRAVT